MIAGLFLISVHSKGFEKVHAEITDLEVEPTGAERLYYNITVKYILNGKAYIRQLSHSSGIFSIDMTINVLYDPINPSAIYNGYPFGEYLMVSGLMVLVLIIATGAGNRKSLMK